MNILYQISVPQPFEINFTCPLFIFGTATGWVPRPPLSSSRVVYSGISLTSSLNWIDTLDASYGCLVLLASSSAFATLFYLYVSCNLVILSCFFFPIYILYCILFLFFTCILLTVFRSTWVLYFEIVLFVYCIIFSIVYFLYCVILCFCIVYFIFLAWKYFSAYQISIN